MGHRIRSRRGSRPKQTGRAGRSGGGRELVWPSSQQDGLDATLPCAKPWPGWAAHDPLSREVLMWSNTRKQGSALHVATGPARKPPANSAFPARKHAGGRHAAAECHLTTPRRTWVLLHVCASQAFSPPPPPSSPLPSLRFAGTRRPKDTPVCAP